MDINRASPLPLYYQLKQILVEKIDKSAWAQGDLIPSELELQDEYGLSRTTVRQTLLELVHEGRLTRHRGKGTFVSTPKIAHDPTTRLEFSEHIRQQGLVPGWQLIERGWEEAPADVRTALGLAAGEQVYRVSLLLLANGDPIARHNSFLPGASVGGIDRLDATDEEILDHIRGLPKLFNCNSTRAFEAVCATAADVADLNMEDGAPVLSIEIKFVAESGTPVELLIAAFRGDRFRYQITI